MTWHPAVTTVCAWLHERGFVLYHHDSTRALYFWLGARAYWHYEHKAGRV